MKKKKKGKYGIPMSTFSLLPNSKQHFQLLEKLESIKNASEREEVAFRLKVIEYHNKYGTEATVEAFGVCRATIYRWKKLLKDSGGRLESLISKSRAPKRKRPKEWHPEIVEFILNYRRLHPRLGKEKLKPIVDKFCLERGLKPVSVSTIGRIIRYLKERGLLRGESRGKLSYHARSGKFYERERRRLRRKRFKRRGKFIEAGEVVEVDTVVYFLDGVKRYLLVGIDVGTRFGFAYGYSHLSSRVRLIANFV